MATLAWLALAAAQAAPAASDVAPAARRRVLIELKQPATDATAIAAEASRAAGVAASYAASAGANWHAIVLDCGDAAACDAALQRLRASGLYRHVETDARKHRMVM